MIKSGGSFFYKGTRFVIGAIVSVKGRLHIVASAHIFHKKDVGVRVQVEGAEGILRGFMEDYDVAIIELLPGCAAEFSDLGSAAVMEDAVLINERHSIRCRVIRAGASLLYLQFPCSDMPEAGDSGSPILQEGKVIGLLSSIMLGNCTGTAVSSDVLRNLNV